MRALDLFCGAGGATKGLQRSGFSVHGIDIARQPHYCGDGFTQADALTYGTYEWLRQFDFIWASPPCQAFTRLRHLVRKPRANLIPQTRQILQAAGVPYCIENVEDAPLDGDNVILLCGTMFGLETPDVRAELWRHRLFETSFSIPLRPACQHRFRPMQKVLTVTGHTPVDNTGRKAVMYVAGNTPESRTGIAARARRAITVTGSTPQRVTFSVSDARAAMGINWMPMSRLSQAIPPCYAEFIARTFLASR